MAFRAILIAVSSDYDGDGYAAAPPTGFREMLPGDKIPVANIPNLDVTAITGLGSALTLKAPLSSPAFTGTPTAPTAAPGTNSAQIATTAFVKAFIDALVGSAPGTLDTLAEIAAALNNDADFAAEITNLVNSKLSKSANLSDLTDAAQARANLGIELPFRASVTIPADESEITLTDANVNESSFIKPFLQTRDATAKSAIAVPGDGEFTIYLDSQATGETLVVYEIFY